MSSRVELTIDGAGVSLATVDTHAFTHAVAEYVALLKCAAEHEGVPVTPKGLRLREGSAVASWGMSGPDEGAHVAYTTANGWVAQDPPPPRKASAQTRRVRKALEEIPDGCVVRTGLDGITRALRVVAPDSVLREEETELLCTVDLVGGKRRATAHLTDPFEPDQLTLEVSSRALAQELAGYLYKKVHVSALLRRDLEGRAQGGQLLSFEPAAPDATGGDMREWFRENGSGWSDVSNVSAELFDAD